MHQGTALVRSTEPLFRQVDGDTVMFHPTRGEYFALDPVGTRVWELLERPITIEAICNRLKAEYDVTFDRCVEDVSDLVGRLRAAGLVEESP
jgi:hypothetical protein